MKLMVVKIILEILLVPNKRVFPIQVNYVTTGIAKTPRPEEEGEKRRRANDEIFSPGTYICTYIHVHMARQAPPALAPSLTESCYDGQPYYCISPDAF